LRVPSASSFQRLMDRMLHELKWNDCLCYMDDILVFGSTFEEHQSRLNNVLPALGNAGLVLNAKNGCLEQKRLSIYDTWLTITAFALIWKRSWPLRISQGNECNSAKSILRYGIVLSSFYARGALSEYVKYQLRGLCRVAKFLLTQKHLITHTPNTCCDFSFVFFWSTGKYFLWATRAKVVMLNNRVNQYDKLGNNLTYEYVYWLVSRCTEIEWDNLQSIF
jgi:hypothetical protein